MTARELSGEQREVAALLSERVRAFEALRTLARDLGLDVELDEGVHLADNIEKRLGRAIRDEMDETDPGA